MKTLRNTLCLALCLLVLPLGALASEAGTTTDMWAKGTVRASETVNLYAPIGGQVKAFDIAQGDDVAQGDVLMEIRPLEVTAPYDGKILIQHAQTGDHAEHITQSYGALCYLEREDIQWLRTTTDTAYSDPENRDIRVGETLRVFNGKTYNRDKREAEGRVVSRDGNAFVVEFPAGIFDVEEEIRVYRGTGTDYKDADMVGRGKTEPAPLLPISAEGIIASVLIREGETVSRGETLYLLDAADSHHRQSADTAVPASADGVLTSLYVQGGQQVRQGQLLMTITPLDSLECVVDVDELDILSLPLGQIVHVKLDARPEALQTATVTRIAPIGKEVLDTTKYEVTLAFATDVPGLLPGMHVTAYWQ